MKPLHRLQEAVDRFELHGRLLADHGVPVQETEELRQLGQRFSQHFIQLDRLRVQLVQIAEQWERP